MIIENDDAGWDDIDIQHEDGNDNNDVDKDTINDDKDKDEDEDEDGDLKPRPGLFQDDEVIDEDKDKDDKDDKDDTDKDDDKDDKDKDDDVEMSAIEQYLVQFDIEGGMISFDDDTSIHFDDLDTAKQFEILETLQQKKIDETVKRFGLDAAETELINKGRDHKNGLDGYIDTLVQERLATNTSTDVDFTKAPADAIMFKALSDKNPDMTKEVIEEKIEALKNNDEIYKEQVDFFREKFVEQGKAAEKAAALVAAQEAEETLNEERALITSTAQGIEDFDGVKLSDEGLNNLLGNILEVDEDNNSLFMSEIFSDPKKLLLAAHRYYNGPKMLEDMEAAHKKEKSEAFKRGRASVLDTSKGDNISFGKPPKKKGDDNSQNKSDDSDTDWDNI